MLSENESGFNEVNEVSQTTTTTLTGETATKYRIDGSRN